MADITNLSQFLSDVADAIRTKKDTTEQIAAENFDQEILSIVGSSTLYKGDASGRATIDIAVGDEYAQRSSDSTINLSVKTGDFVLLRQETRLDNIYFYRYVLWEVLEPDVDANHNFNGVCRFITADTTDGTATSADIVSGKTAYVNNRCINGSAEIVNNQDKEITENGTYTADEGYTGLGTVTVNVSQEGGSGDVKLFETEEQMQSDPDVKENDLAVVYREEIQSATVDSKFQIATFPETVVLDEAITDYIDMRYRAVDDSVMFDCCGWLDSSNFVMDCYTETSSITIEYTSSDGITYTRTDSTGNPVDFGTEIYYYYTEMWNDVIGKFIKCGVNVFEGLHLAGKKLVHTVNYDYTIVDNNLTSKSIEYDYDELIKDLGLGSPSGSCLVLVSNYSDDKPIRYWSCGYANQCIIWYDNMLYFGLCSASEITNNMYAYYYDIGGSNVYPDISTAQKMVIGSKYYYIFTDSGINDNKEAKYFCYASGNQSFPLYYIEDNVVTVGDVVSNTGNYHLQWILAPTQFNLDNANQLLPGKIAYGKNGVVTGDVSVYEQIPKSINIENVLGYIPDKDNMDCIGTIDDAYDKGTLLVSTKLDELDNILNRLQLRYVTNTILDNMQTKINEYMGTTNYGYTFEGSTDTYLYFYYRDNGSNTGKVIYYMCRYNKITNQFDGKNVFTAATFTVAQYQYYMSNYFYKVPNTHNCYDFIYPNNAEKTYCVNMNFDNMTAMTVYTWSSRDTQVCEGGCCTIGDYLYGFYYQYSNKVFRIKLSTNTMTLGVYSNSASSYPMYYRPQVAIKNGIPYIVFWFSTQMVLFKLSSDGSSITSTKTIFTTSSTKYAKNMTQFDYGDDTYFLTSDTYNFGTEFQGFKLALDGSTELLTGWNISSLPSTYEQHNTNVYFKQINDIIYCVSINSATLYKIDVLNKATTVSKYHTNTITSDYTYIYDYYNTKLKEIDDMKRIYTVEQSDGATVYEVTLLCYLGYGYTLFNNVKEIYSIITKLDDKCKIVYKSLLENLFPDYTDTIAPEEYNTAIATADEILGEEV